MSAASESEIKARARENGAREETKAPSAGAAEPLLNEAQAANYLNVSVRTLQQWRVSGRGPGFTKLSRAVRYRRADLDAFIANGVAQSTTEADACKRAS
jgi:excisionase family DNA binding protein